MIRRCSAVTKLGPGSLQSWAGDVIEILREAHQATAGARARDEPRADPELLAKLRQRYDEAVTSGITHNRHRDWHDGVRRLAVSGQLVSILLPLAPTTSHSAPNALTACPWRSRPRCRR
jgi:hypothetical protein